jgi:hypothetical protein
VNETDDQRIDRLKKESDELRNLADDHESQLSPRSIDLRKHADEKHDEAMQLMERQLEDSETITATDTPCALIAEERVTEATDPIDCKDWIAITHELPRANSYVEVKSTPNSGGAWVVRNALSASDRSIPAIEWGCDTHWRYPKGKLLDP